MPDWAKPLTDKEKEILSNVSVMSRLAQTAKFAPLTENVTDLLMQAGNGTPEGTLQELRHLRTLLDEIDRSLEPYLRSRSEARKVIANRLGRR